jgi:antitoxin ParD1/3/4
MNVSLPGTLKNWVEQQSQSGEYANSSDYVRDLIRRDQERQTKIGRMQALVSQGLESGLSDQSMNDVKAEALTRLKKSKSGE